MTDESPAAVYLQTISILAAALRSIRDTYPPGHLGHDTARSALDAADRIQPSHPEPELRYALVQQMGHKSMVGAVSEVTYLGKPMLEVRRIDVVPAVTVRVSPDSLYDVTDLTGAQAEALAQTYGRSTGGLDAAGVITRYIGRTRELAAAHDDNDVVDADIVDDDDQDREDYEREQAEEGDRVGHAHDDPGDEDDHHGDEDDDPLPASYYADARVQ